MTEKIKKYKVIFANSCDGSPYGDVAERIKEKAELRRSGLNETKEDIIKAASKVNTQELEKLNEMIARIESCTTFDEVCSLDKKINTQNQSHDLWKHCDSPNKGCKDTTAWEFRTSEHGRIYCYIEHNPSKTVLIMDAGFTPNNSHLKKNHENLSDLANDIYNAISGTELLTEVRNELEAVNVAKETKKQLSFDYQNLNDLVTSLEAMQVSQTPEQQEEAVNGLNDFLDLLLEAQKDAIEKNEDTMGKEAFDSILEVLNRELEERNQNGESTYLNPKLHKIKTPLIERAIGMMEQKHQNDVSFLLKAKEKQAQ